MSLHYILDGYNLIKRIPSISSQKLRYSRESLLKFIKDRNLCGSKKNKITIVFDGKEDINYKQNFKEFEVIFTKNESADEKIIKVVKNALNPKLCVVVSDDKLLKFSVRSLKAKVLSVEEFVNRKKHLKFDKIYKDKLDLPLKKAQEITEELKKIWLR